MKKIYNIIKWALLLVVTIMVLLILYIRFSRYTDTIIYKMNDTSYNALETTFNYEEFYFDRGNKTKIHGVLFKTEAIYPKGTIMHYPGKGMTVQSSQKYYQALLLKGFQVFSFERRGFGKSTGIADNSLILKEDALHIFDEILKHKNVINTPIIIWGQSLGGAFATMNAAERQEKIKGLILEGTFSSFPDIGKVYADVLHLENFKGLIPLLLNNDFPAEKEIKKIHKPVLIIHSNTDKEVPYALGEKLYNASNKSNTQFWEIKGKHIKGVLDFEDAYLKKFENMAHQ